MPRWRLYYADGSTCDDTVPLPDVPRFGVVSATFADETGRCLAECADVYVLHRDGSWTGHDAVGLAQMLTRSLDDVVAVAYGLQVSDRVWSRVHGRAVVDCDFAFVPSTMLVACPDGGKALLYLQPDGSWKGRKL